MAYRQNLFSNLWVEPSLCKRLTEIDRDSLWISIKFFQVSFHVLYIFSVNCIELFLSRFPTFLSYVRFLGCPPDIVRISRRWLLIWRLFSVPRVSFWVNLGQKWRNSSFLSVRISLTIFQVQVLKFCDIIFIVGLS